MGSDIAPARSVTVSWTKKILFWAMVAAVCGATIQHIVNGEPWVLIVADLVFLSVLLPPIGNKIGLGFKFAAFAVIYMTASYILGKFF